MILGHRGWARAGAVAALCLALAACAATGRSPQSERPTASQSERTQTALHLDREQLTSLLTRELTPIAVAPDPKQSIYYLGLALYSEIWSQNDVVELAKELPASAPTLAVRSV